MSSSTAYESLIQSSEQIEEDHSLLPEALQNDFSLIHFHVSVKNISQKPNYSPKKIVIARGSEVATSESILEDHWSRKTTKMWLTRFIIWVRARDRRCEIVKTSKSMTKINLNRKGATKSKWATSQSSLKTNLSKFCLIFSRCDTGISAELISQSIEMRLLQETQSQSTSRRTNRVQKHVSLREEKIH